MSDNDGVQVSGQRDAGKCSAVQEVNVTVMLLMLFMCTTHFVFHCLWQIKFRYFEFLQYN